MKHIIYTSIVMLLACTHAQAQSPFAGGLGTEAAPYQITTLAQLNAIRGTYLNAHFILMNNLDFNGYRYHADDAENAKGWLPIGEDGFGNPFTGSFNGNNKVIENLFISRASTNSIGLFGVIGSGASVSDVGLDSVDIVGNRFVGGLVGTSVGTISNCYATGDVRGEGFSVGGLVGYSFSTISTCYATGDVRGNSDVGGLVGTSVGTISNCYATGDVRGERNSVGGLVGDYDSGGTISNCYATGDVRGSDGVGGLVGWRSFGTISNCYATGDVRGRSSVGGLVGRLSNGTISNCYTTGDVRGEDSVGGLVGFSEGTISNCYATGDVRGRSSVGGLVGELFSGTISNCYTTGDVSGEENVGGLVGRLISGTIRNCYWNTETSTAERTAGLIGTEGRVENSRGLTTQAMYAQASFNGFDFVNAWHPPVSSSTFPALRAHEKNVQVLSVQTPALTLPNAPPFALSFEFLSPVNIAGADTTFTSETPTIATINEEGIISPVRIGTAIIRVTRTGDARYHAVSKRVSFGISTLRGAGTETAPYQITTLTELNAIRSEALLTKHYILMNNLDFNGYRYHADDAENAKGWLPIGEGGFGNRFTGSFNGNNKVIKNLFISRASTNSIGLFGLIGSGASVSDVGLDSVDIVGGSDVGGLVGLLNSSGTISNCYATGDVRGNNSWVGGLVGELASNGVVADLVTSTIVCITLIDICCVVR